MPSKLKTGPLGASVNEAASASSFHRVKPRAGARSCFKAFDTHKAALPPRNASRSRGIYLYVLCGARLRVSRRTLSGTISVARRSGPCECGLHEVGRPGLINKTTCRTETINCSPETGTSTDRSLSSSRRTEHTLCANGGQAAGHVERSQSSEPALPIEQAAKTGERPSLQSIQILTSRAIASAAMSV